MNNNWILFALISLIVYIPSLIATNGGMSTRDKYSKYRQGGDVREYKPSTSEGELKDLIQKYYKDKYPSYPSEGKDTKKDEGKETDGYSKYRQGGYDREYKPSIPDLIKKIYDYKDEYPSYRSDGKYIKKDEYKGGNYKDYKDGYSKYGSDDGLAAILDKLKRIYKDNYGYDYDGYGRYENDKRTYSSRGRRGSSSSSGSSGRRGSRSGSGSSSSSGRGSGRRDRSRNERDEKDGGYKGYYDEKKDTKDTKDAKDRMSVWQRDGVYNDDKTRYDRSHQWSVKADRNGGDDSGKRGSRSKSSSSSSSDSGSKGGSGSQSGRGSKSKGDRDRGDGNKDNGKEKDEICCDRGEVERMEESYKCRREGCECCPDGTYVASIGDGKKFFCGGKYLVKGKDQMGEICRADYYYYKRSEY